MATIKTCFSCFGWANFCANVPDCIPPYQFLYDAYIFAHNAHDLEGTDVLLEAFLDQSRILLADIAYAAKARLLDRLEQRQVEEVIPPKSNQKEPWKFARDKYRWWRLIKNFFAKLKQYRGIATHYDKRVCAFLGGVRWVAVIWLNWWPALVYLLIPNFVSFEHSKNVDRW